MEEFALLDLEYLESQVDFRMFTMTVDEYAAALAIESVYHTDPNIN
jgi:hypothetical protein